MLVPLISRTAVFNTMSKCAVIAFCLFEIQDKINISTFLDITHCTNLYRFFYNNNKILEFTVFKI